jgi:hypothetical protein
MLVGAALLALLALLAIGCGRESNAPPPGVVDEAEAAHVEPAGVAEKPAPGEALDAAYSGESEAPALPLDVPLYAAAAPISSMSSPTRGTIVNLRSQDAADLVSAWYGTELPARGWHLQTQSGATNSHLVTAVKEGRKATVLITGGPDGTQILLTVLDDR